MLQAKTDRPGTEHFLREIETLADLPEPVRAVIQQNMIRSRRIIYVPSQAYPIQHSKFLLKLPFQWRRTPQRTLVFGDEQILIVDGLTQESLQTYTIPLSDLLSIRLASALLYMYLELTWKDKGKAETIKIEFNAVGERRIKCELDAIRTTIAARHPFGPFPETSISHFPYKFQTYTYGDLLPRETLWVGVYEPKIATSTLYLRTFLSPNRATLLTDQHLLILEDQNRRLFEADLSEYWMSRCFIPRSRVRSVNFENELNVTWMTVTLDGHSDIRVPLLEPRAVALQEAFETWL